MRSKVVAVQEVVALPRAALGTHVDMDVTRARRRGTEVTALIVAAAELDPDPLDRGDVRALVGEVPHADLDVDYRFGIEPRHGGRADVLNPPRNRTEHARELGAVAFEAGPPLRVSGDDLDRLVGGVAARDRCVPGALHRPVRPGTVPVASWPRKTVRQGTPPPPHQPPARGGACAYGWSVPCHRSPPSLWTAPHLLFPHQRAEAAPVVR